MTREMKNRGIIPIIITLTFLAVPSMAYFKDIGVGVRPTGMGGVYVAISDDANAVLWNASGIAQTSKQEITAMYSALYTGLDAKLYTEDTDQIGYHFVSYVHPIYRNIGAFGLSWATFQSRFYDENTFSLSYARNTIKNLYAGLNLKRLSWSIEDNEYTRLDKDIPASGITVDGFTFDLSALYKSTRRTSWGLSVENLLPADVGLNTEQIVPVTLRAGLAYKVDGLGSVKNIETTAAIDIVHRRGSPKETDVRAGFEMWFLDKCFATRAGFRAASGALGFSYRVSRGVFELQIDYAFTYPILSIQNTYGSHRLSISARF